MTTSSSVNHSGWTRFAGIFLAIVGLFNVIEGIVALVQKSHFNESGLVYQNLKFWGWVMLIVGIIQLVSGWLVIDGNAVGRYLGMIIVVISMVVSFVFLGAYPAWSIVTLVIDGCIIYGLSVSWPRPEAPDSLLYLDERKEQENV
jgi:hypothetical protein